MSMRDLERICYLVHRRNQINRSRLAAYMQFRKASNRLYEFQLVTQNTETIRHAKKRISNLEYRKKWYEQDLKLPRSGDQRVLVYKSLADVTEEIRQCSLVLKELTRHAREKASLMSKSKILKLKSAASRKLSYDKDFAQHVYNSKKLDMRKYVLETTEELKTLLNKNGLKLFRQANNNIYAIASADTGKK